MRQTVLAFAAALTAFAAAAAGAADLAACYQAAGDDLTKKTECLKQEAEAVDAEYDEAAEKVLAEMKSIDKAESGKKCWKSMLAAHQAFSTYVKRECAAAAEAEVSSAVGAENTELACRINLQRMRTDMLKTRYLSKSSKK
jgi:uncharacterized protein YecT (DUF1311 family)